MRCETSTSISSKTMSMLAMAALHGRGSLEWECPTTNPEAETFSSISSVVIVALMDTPPPKCLDMVKISGTTPSCSKPHIEPNLARPVWASSTINKAPRSSHRRFSSCSHPSGRSMTPPALNRGSVITPANWPSAWASRRSKLVFRQV